MKKRIVVAIISLLLIIVFNFALPRLMPGDTVLMLTGIEENSMTEEQYAFYAEKLGVNKPILTQFGDYFVGILTGDLGYSYHYNANITDLILDRLPNTLQIALPAIILSALLAILLGCTVGMKKGSPLEHVVTSATIVGDSMPSFITGLLLIVLFAFNLGILPSGSLNSIRVPSGFLPALWDRVIHLILPVVTLVIAYTPSKYLMLLNTVASQCDEKYVLYAKSRGFSDTYIAFKHIFPNICQPFLNLVGINIGFIVSGSLVIENIFSIKGMGMLISQGIAMRDYPVLQGCLFVSALVIVIATILTDIVCRLSDPKVRYKVHELE